LQALGEPGRFCDEASESIRMESRYATGVVQATAPLRSLTTCCQCHSLYEEDGEFCWPPRDQEFVSYCGTRADRAEREHIFDA